MSASFLVVDHEKQLTIVHKPFFAQRFLELPIQWQAPDIHGRIITCQIPNTRHEVEIVGESDSMTSSHFKDFVFTIAVEGCPLDGRAFPLFRTGSGPVEILRITRMPNDELSAFVMTRKRDNERSELGRGTRSVNVGFEETGWCGVYLNHISAYSRHPLYTGEMQQRIGSYVELVQFSLDPLCCYIFTRTRH